MELAHLQQDQRKLEAVLLYKLLQTVITEFTDEVQQIAALLQPYTGSKLTILEIPIYSISIWNKHKNHPEFSRFKEEDVQLEEQIVETNRLIRYINSTLGSYSLKFSSDLAVNSRYRKGIHHNKVGRRSRHNFNLYKDGIHPDRILSGLVKDNNGTDT